MPPLDNPRHERFAQELAKGKSADEAYQLAGYSENRGNAARLKANESILKRVAEVQSKGAEKAAVTLESLLTELDEARDLALKIEQPAAMVAATREKAILSGLRVEKRETTNKTDPKQMSDDELAAIASAGRGGVVAPPSRSRVSH